jgi:N-acylneuraminate cytidylyltransferase
VRRAYAAFVDGGRRSQVSCFRFGWANPWWAIELDGDGRGRFLFPDATERRSQDLPPLHGLTGAVWIADAELLLRERTFFVDDLAFFPLDWRAAIDVDEPEDLELVTALLAVR